MRQKLFILIAFVTLLAAPAVSFAWNAAGHMLIALIAYENMAPQQRTAMVALLNKHPRFQEDFLDRMPVEIKSQAQAIQDQWIFMHAATWPDIARGLKGDLREKYHHGPWHYINVPIFLTDGDRVAMKDRLPVPIEREWSPAAHPDPQNAPQAYQKCMLDLSSPHTSEADKAVALCWVLHLIGDIHQPLHACALFSREHFPGGDHGGNYLIIDPDEALHSYWDGLLGDDTSLPTLSRLRGQLRAFQNESRVSAAATASMSFGRWIDESFKLADERAYTDEMRRIVQAGKAPEKKVVRVGKLTPHYETQARFIAQRRVVEAGYRTAKALEAVRPTPIMPTK